MVKLSKINSQIIIDNYDKIPKKIEDKSLIKEYSPKSPKSKRKSSRRKTPKRKSRRRGCKYGVKKSGGCKRNQDLNSNNTC